MFPSPDAPGAPVFLAGFRELADQSAIFTHGEGCWLTDNQGHRYLDFSSQYWNTNLGHRHPRAIRAVQEAAAESLFLNLRFGQSASVEPFCEMLRERFSDCDVETVQLMTSGTMAIEAAIKIARLVTARPLIVSFRRSYHGMALGALAATGYRELAEPFGRHDDRHLWIEAFDEEELERVLRQHGARIAALIAEPVISNQCLVPPDGFWPWVSGRCRQEGILLVADEVVSGIGRCGHWSGAALWGMEPDLIALGKGLSAGLVPLAALLHGHRTSAALRGRTLLHGQTFDGYDLGCRVGAAIIGILEDEDLLERTRERSVFLRQGLEGMARRLGPRRVAEVRGWGLFYGLEIAANAIPDSGLHPFAHRMQEILRRHGLLLGGLGRVLLVAPPLVVSEDELRIGLGRLEAAMWEEFAGMTE
ncbi:MAG: aspartate aminotransferase family protein [Sumerlaeia bacterium]